MGRRQSSEINQINTAKVSATKSAKDNSVEQMN